MGIYKRTFYFQQGNAGWSNVIYRSADTLDLAKAPDPAFFFNLLAPMSSVSRLVAIRTQDVTDTRLSYLERYNQSDPGNEGLAADLPSTAVQLILNGTTGGNRTWWVRGLRDDAILVNSAAQPYISAVLRNELNDLLRSFANAGYHIQKLTTVNDEPWRAVNYLEQVPNTNYTDIVLMDTSISWSVGDRIYFRNSPKCNFPGLTGSFVVVLAEAGKVTIRVPWPLSQSTAAFPELFVRRQIYTYVPISGGSIGKVGKRDTGRPFDLSRGRASGTSCRRSVPVPT